MSDFNLSSDVAVTSAPCTVPVAVKFLNDPISLLPSTTTAFDATTVPAEEPSSKFNSDAVEVTPSKIFNSAAVEVIAVPPNVIDPEIEKVLPEVVTDGEYKSVAYGNIVGVLIEAIKEQQKQIDELKKDKHGSSD